MENLFDDIPAELPEEQFVTLLRSKGLHIERIVSRGQASPAEGWYDQDHDEWVLLLRGAARLAFEGDGERRLEPGDFLHIPAHCRHRVAWTDPDVATVWLAVHY